VVAVVCVALALTALVLRFVATTRVARRVGWEDWFAVLATVFFIAYAVPFLYLLVVSNGKPSADLTKEDFLKMTISGYVMAAQFCMQQLFAKLSLLFLYYRLFWINRSFVICIYILGSIQICWSIATYIVHWLECSPPQKLWHKQIAGHCVNPSAFLAAGETPNSLVDFALVGMAIWMVQSLGMKTSVKVKLAVLFALGGLAGILGFVKIGEGFTPMSTEKVELLDPIWATVQQTCSVICCCAPLYKSLIPELGLFAKLRSLSNRTLGRGSTREKGQGDQHSDEGARVPTVGGGTWKKPDTWDRVDEASTRESSLTQVPSRAGRPEQV